MPAYRPFAGTIKASFVPFLFSFPIISDLFISHYISYNPLSF